MTVYKLLVLFFFLTVSLSACSQNDQQPKVDTMKDLSEKTGIEMIVIDEAQKIMKVSATRFLGQFMGSSFVDDPIHSSIRQEFPKTKTVELQGISFLAEHDKIIELVDTINRKFAYRNCISFISDDNSRDDNKQTLTIIHSSDKFDMLRLQRTSGGSNLFSTDSLVLKLQELDKKYPFDFLGVGTDWCLLRFKEAPKDYMDFAKLVDKVCPLEDLTHITMEAYAGQLKDVFTKSRNISMWWD